MVRIRPQIPGHTHTLWHVLIDSLVSAIPLSRAGLKVTIFESAVRTIFDDSITPVADKTDAAIEGVWGSCGWSGTW